MAVEGNLWLLAGLPRAVPRELNLALRVDKWPPEGFSESKSKATSEAKPKAEGLAEDVTEGLPEENPKSTIEEFRKNYHFIMY